MSVPRRPDDPIARRNMIRVRRDDFEDPHELAKFAATAGLSLEEFKAQFEYLMQAENALNSRTAPLGAAAGGLV